MSRNTSSRDPTGADPKGSGARARGTTERAADRPGAEDHEARGRNADTGHQESGVSGVAPAIDGGRATRDRPGPDPASAERPGKAGRVALFRPGPVRHDAPLNLDQRTGQMRWPSPGSFAPLTPDKAWRSLTAISPTPAFLAANGLVWGLEDTPGALAFDMLRTRVLQAMAKRNWLCLGVTGPDAGAGASFVAANLALSAAQLPSCRTVLLDLDLRNPALAWRFGLADAPALTGCLIGDEPFESHFRRLGENLALGLNGVPSGHSAETIQHPAMGEALSAMRDMFQPDLVILDMPPTLASDDVLALAPQLDAVLLVIDGHGSTPGRVRECLRLLEGQVPLLGVVLNRARDRGRRGTAKGG